jgi:hypothetical protein
MLRLEVFNVQLPVLASVGDKNSSSSTLRSPRAANVAALDEYLAALASMASSISDCKTFRAFLTSNVAPVEPTKFWDADVRKRGWLFKKKGDRAKLQKRFCVLKFGTL